MNTREKEIGQNIIRTLAVLILFFIAVMLYMKNSGEAANENILTMNAAEDSLYTGIDASNGNKAVVSALEMNNVLEADDNAEKSRAVYKDNVNGRIIISKLMQFLND